MEQVLVNWISAILIIFVFTLLLPLKEHYLYRIVETIFIAAMAGHACVTATATVTRPATLISTGDFFQFIPLILGLLLFTRFAKGYTWFARYPVALLVGMGTGLSVRASAEAQIIAQLRATILPLAVPRMLDAFNNFCIMIMVPASILYFLFTRPGKGNVGKVLDTISRLGRIIVLAALGSMYGNLLMARITGLIGILQFLFFDWLKISV